MVRRNEWFKNPSIAPADSAQFPEHEFENFGGSFQLTEIELDGNKESISPKMITLELQTPTSECFCCWALHQRLEKLKQLNQIHLVDMSQKMEEMRLQVNPMIFIL
jgi:hypothetical protein